jgi:hypothetical protein
LVFYVLLRLSIPGEQIAPVLYAIYAFQIVIAPSIIWGVFFRKRLCPSAVVSSVVVGIVVAYITAAHPVGTAVQGWLGADSVSWQVMPPLITAIVATTAFAGASWIAGFFSKRPKRRPKAS